MAYTWNFHGILLYDILVTLNLTKASSSDALINLLFEYYLHITWNQPVCKFTLTEKRIQNLSKRFNSPVASDKKDTDGDQCNSLFNVIKSLIGCNNCIVCLWKWSMHIESLWTVRHYVMRPTIKCSWRRWSH